MRAIRVMWIDGQTKDGNGTHPARLELRRDEGNEVLYRWYAQDYNDAGKPDGDCTIDTDVSAKTVSDAMQSADQSWGGTTWNLRRNRKSN